MIYFILLDEQSQGRSSRQSQQHKADKGQKQGIVLIAQPGYKANGKDQPR
jgi:hypothetical protein